MADEIDSLIAKIQLPENKAINERILEDDNIKDYQIDIDKLDNELITDFNKKFDKKEDYKLIKALEEALSITLPNLLNKEVAFYISLPVEANNINNREQSPY